jgi:hypothetical protein
MPKYKNRSHIDFIKLNNFDKVIKENDGNADFDVAKLFMDTWYKGYPIELFMHCQKEFYKAVETPGKVQNYKFSIDLKKAEQFIDLDTLIHLDKELFINLAVKKKFFWQSGIVNLETANYVFSLFINEPPK